MSRFALSLFLLAIFAALANAAAHNIGRGDDHHGDGGNHGHHHGPRPSQTSTCTPSAAPPATCYVCPPTDNAGFAVGDNSDTSPTLFCSYPAFSGESPNDFFCDYNDQTGVLTTDNDAGFCPGTAVATACVVRRENVVEALKRRARARAAQPQTSRPRFMTSRNALKKRAD